MICRVANSCKYLKISENCTTWKLIEINRNYMDFQRFSIM